MAAQTFRSNYGRKGIRVSVQCPTREIRARLGWTHVGTSLEDVEAMIREAVAAHRAERPGVWTDKLEAEAVRFARWQHEENRAEHRYVMGGH